MAEVVGLEGESVSEEVAREAIGGCLKSPLGPLGFKCSQHGPTTRPSVQAAVHFFCPGTSRPMPSLVQAGTANRTRPVL